MSRPLPFVGRSHINAIRAAGQHRRGSAWAAVPHSIGREAVRTQLAETRFEACAMTPLLGLAVPALHAAGRIRWDRIGIAWAGEPAR